MSSLHYQGKVKVTCPALPAVHLHREVLVHRLHEVLNGTVAEREKRSSSYKLTLLHAPAGYGKTILLVDFAQHTDLPCCWYILDQTDTDRISFLTLLLLSIRQQFPDFGHTLDPLLTGTVSERANQPATVNYFEMVIETLVSAIEREIPRRFALMLCNYQEINELPEMNALVSLLLRKLPPQCVLVIESRSIPNLDFAQLLAGQMIFGIGQAQLRFTAQQIHELAQIQGMEPLTDAEARQLVFTFDGWIAGILLGTRLNNVQQLHQSVPPSRSKGALEQQATSQYLFSYVVNEVFKRHQKVYTFLKEVCVLQEMPPALCAGLLDIPLAEAHAHLQYLEQHNLFVTRSGEGAASVYTCTPVLRKLFYEDLRHEAPLRFSALHQRAAELLSATSQYSQAIYHALEASVDDIAAGLILTTSEQMMNQGHAETLARWIDAFPPEITNLHPRLLLLRAHIYLQQGETQLALPLLASADAAVQALSNQASPLDTYHLSLIQAETAIARSRILFRQREYQQGEQICQQVLASLPKDEVTLRADAHMRLGLCHSQMGELTAGIAQIQKALQLWGRHTVRRQTADGHSLLARAYGLLGNFSLAEHHMTRALTCWDQLEDLWGKIDNLVRLGELKVYQGAFQEAETVLQEALTLARGPIHFLRGQAYALGCLGLVYQRQQRYERALEVAEEALALARQIRDQHLIDELLCDLAMIYLYMGDTATALLLISDVEVQTANGGPIGYKRATRDLICGTIYLYQRHYQQAGPYLSESEAMLGKAGVKQEHLQALLRLAAYHLAQGQVCDAVRYLDIAAPIATICEGYEQLVKLEMHQLPDLQHALCTLPELAQTKASFRLASEPQATSVQKESPPVPVQAPPVPVVPAVAPLEIVTKPYKLTIRALGEPAVYLQQEPITRWRMARAMELCFYLLDCAHPMRKDVIITALWPEVEEQTTRTFYSTIYYLRQALGGEAVISAKGGTYTLRLDALYGDAVWYDVAAFKNYQTQAKHALDEEQDAEAKASYQAMVDLYRGDYVQPFYSDWCTMRRDELRSAYLEAHQQLALIAWRAEELDESIVHWQHMLAIDDWLEEAHYGLMRCYARQSKRGLALRQYQRCNEALEREFGTAPRASIQNFYQRLMGSLSRPSNMAGSDEEQT